MQVNNNVQPYQLPYVQQTNALEKIATNLAINRASDNAAAFAIADNLRTEANGYSIAIDNATSAVAFTQIGDKAIGEQSNILDNIKEKLLQASTDTTSQDGREAILKDVQALVKDFDQIAEVTNYSGTNLLQNSSDDKSSSSQQTFQVGNENGDDIALSEIQSNSEGVGIDNLLSIDPATFSSSDARDLLSSIDDASTKLNEFRQEFGSTQNQLLSHGRNLTEQEIQTRSAEYDITAANVAEQISNISKQNVLSYAGAYAHSQSNTNQQSVLRLLT